MPTPVQDAGNTVRAGVNVTCSVSLGRATQTNNLVVLVISASHPRENFVAFLFDPPGFSRVWVRKEDKLTVGMWQRTAAPAMTRASIQTLGETYGVQMRMLEFSGVAQASAVDRVVVRGDNPEGRPGSTTPNTGSSGTLSQSDELVLGVVVNRYGSTTQGGFTGGLAKVSESISYTGEPDHDQQRMTIHTAYPNSTAAFTFGARLSSNRDWVAALVTFKGATIGPAKMSSKAQPPVITVGGRAQLTVFGPVRSRNQRPMITISGRGWIGPFNYQYSIGGREGLLIGDSTPYTVESHDGLEGWTIRTADGELPRGDGARRGIDLQASRQVLFNLKVGGTQLEVESQMDALYRALVPRREEDLELIWRHPGRPLRMLRCRPVDMVRELSWRETIVNHQQVSLLAADPRIYSVRTREALIPVTPAGSDTQVTAVSVPNTGNANAYPVIRIRGAPDRDVTRIQLINANADVRFEVAVVLSPRSELVADMPAIVTAAPRSPITLDGQPKYSSWVYPREPFYLAPDPVAPGGINAVYLRTEPAGAAVTAVLEYRDTWAG